MKITQTISDINQQTTLSDTLARYWPVPFLLLWPVVLALPSLMGFGTTRALFLVVFILGILPLLISVLIPQILSRSWSASWLIISLLAVLMTYAIYRAPDNIMNATTKFGATMGPIIFFLFLVLSLIQGHTEMRVRILLYSLPLFVALSVGLHYAFPPTSLGGAPNSILSAFGVTLPRLSNLPGIVGSSNIAIVSGASLLCAVFLASSHERARLVAIFLLIPSAWALILSDTRATIFFSLIVIFLYLFSSSRASKLIAQIAISFCLVSAPILTLLFYTANEIGFGEILGRSQDIGYRLGAGTGRPIVWAAVFDELTRFKVNHIVGYGLYGDNSSGVSSSYSWMFSGLIGPPTYHNTALQFILDTGYVTLFLFFAILFYSTILISDSVLQERTKKLMLLMLTLICLGGTTESFFTVQKFESLFIGLIVIGVAFAAPRGRLKVGGIDQSIGVHMGRGAKGGTTRRQGLR